MIFNNSLFQFSIYWKKKIFEMSLYYKLIQCLIKQLFDKNNVDLATIYEKKFY